MDSNDISALEALVEKYIAAINTCDPALADAIWSHGEDVSFVAPAGRFASHESIRDDLILGIFARKFSKRRLQKLGLKIHPGADLAWIEFQWSFDAVTTEGAQVHNKGLETQIARRENGTWELVHIHYSRI